MAKLLNKELKTYNSMKGELLARARGKYVLIKDTQLVGVYDTQNDAIRQGYSTFGNVPFLVKEITEYEAPLTFTSNLLAR